MAKKVTAMLPYYGANRMGAELVGELLAGCAWVGVPYAGGMSELLHITASTILVNDLNFHAINLARCIKDSDMRACLIEEVDNALFHPRELQEAQARCEAETPHIRAIVEKGSRALDGARDYFISQWMGRSGNSGTDREFKGALPVRWTSSGGDSCKRYRSATEALKELGVIFRRCSFVCMDAAEVIAETKDQDGHGLYVDRDWPDEGELYKHHEAGEASHRATHDALMRFKKTRVVVRYGIHPMIEKIYSRDNWRWVTQDTRTQGNNVKDEVYLVRN